MKKREEDAAPEPGGEPMSVHEKRRMRWVDLERKSRKAMRHQRAKALR